MTARTPRRDQWGPGTRLSFPMLRAAMYFCIPVLISLVLAAGIITAIGSAPWAGVSPVAYTRVAQGDASARSHYTPTTAPSTSTTTTSPLAASVPPSTVPTSSGANTPTTVPYVAPTPPVATPPATSSATPGDPWYPVAICEEGGNDDPNYGYYGIQEWNGYDGYVSAGAAPIGVQQAWGYANNGGPPSWPGEYDANGNVSCAEYHGW